MKAFTMIETLLVLAIISLLTYLSLNVKSPTHLKDVENELLAKNLAAQIIYMKSTAIKNHDDVILFFNRGSNRIKVINQNHQVSYITITKGEIVISNNMDIVVISPEGEFNRFGSVYIKFNQTTFRFIFHIEKGSLRIEKTS
ncbi:competence type IV pilus minor pilin ComGD [Staphylococcus simulans]|uniref:competence type IV pilus minor pilin ComGD n=1 Tax=Staphylococcus simulans TaxID=1286 RepID=UPI000D1FBDC0|nr:competence type IV pilus minor pilin ComGD [Staphylococcus simulans]PTI85306.1 prepilin-type cleavage/methylation domain-containing protein [Staphylococcus simulans]